MEYKIILTKNNSLKNIIFDIQKIVINNPQLCLIIDEISENLEREVILEKFNINKAPVLLIIINKKEDQIEFKKLKKMFFSKMNTFPLFILKNKEKITKIYIKNKQY